jgi:hypothetical protein
MPGLSDKASRLAHTWRKVACSVGALISFTILSLSPSIAVAQTPQPQQAVQPQQTPQAEAVDGGVRDVLTQYGTFVQHPKYGEVWVPSVTPPGWHPYPPCSWIKTRKYGWYYNDKTPWGAIIHHYGRWVFTQDMGWIWTPGAEFSPGWVVWRSNPQYIGWAPMLPEQDIQAISADAFNGSDQWLFMEAAKFGSGCSGNLIVAKSRIQPLLEQTTYVTHLEYVDGIAVFVLPPYVIGPYIDISISFDPYPIEFFTQIVVDFNFIFHHFSPKVKVVSVCTFAAPH